MKFSLVVPLAPERNAEILKSIKELNYPKSEFHVIVVKGRNPSENRNKGVEKSKGEIIGFLDDDAVVDKSLLKNTDEFFKKHGEIDIVGGPQMTPPDEKRFAKISGYALSSQFGAWKMSSRYARKKEKLDVDETMLTSANLFCRKKVTEKVKFNPNLYPGEDPKFIEEAKEKGFKVAYSPNLIIYHRRRANVKGLIKQVFNYGKFRPTKESFLETLKKPFFLMPSIFFFYLVLLLFIIFINPPITGNVIGFSNFIGNVNFNFLLFLPLILYSIFNLGFSIYESGKNKNITALFILPFIFLIIHLSYGAGMIYGYVKKITNKF